MGSDLVSKNCETSKKELVGDFNEELVKCSSIINKTSTHINLAIRSYFR